MDESAYLNFAWVLRHGKLYSDQVGISTTMALAVGEHQIPKYPPGMSLLLSVFSLPTWTFALGTNLLVQIATVFVVAALLKQLKVSPVWAVLYFLHPTVVIYSRTLMSDLLGGLAIGAALLMHIQKRPVFVGILIGLSILVRTANGIILPLLILGNFLERGEEDFLARVKYALKILLGVIPFVLVAWLYQKYIQDGGWGKYGGASQFSLDYFKQHLVFYSVAMMLVFPGLLLAPALYRGAGKWAIRMVCYGILFFYSAYYYLDSTDSKVESFIIGQRFMLAVIPLFIVCYGSVIGSVFAKLKTFRVVNSVMILSVMLLFVSAGAIHWKHQKKLKEMILIRESVSRNIPENSILFCNTHVAKLLHPAWTGVRRYQLVAGGASENSEIEAIEQAVKQGAKPVFWASWSRAYRPETPDEKQELASLKKRFAVKEVAENSDELEIVQLESR